MAGTESLTTPSDPAVGALVLCNIHFLVAMPLDKQQKVIFLESVLYQNHKNSLLSLTTKTEWLCNTGSPAGLLIFRIIKCY